jgi:hypothetical protein
MPKISGYSPFEIRLIVMGNAEFDWQVHVASSAPAAASWQSLTNYKLN